MSLNFILLLFKFLQILIFLKFDILLIILMDIVLTLFIIVEIQNVIFILHLVHALLSFNISFIVTSLCLDINIINFKELFWCCKYHTELVPLYPRSIRSTFNWWHWNLFDQLVLCFKEDDWRMNCWQVKRQPKLFIVFVLNLRKNWA